MKPFIHHHRKTKRQRRQNIHHAPHNPRRARSTHRREELPRELRHPPLQVHEDRPLEVENLVVEVPDLGVELPRRGRGVEARRVVLVRGVREEELSLREVLRAEVRLGLEGKGGGARCVAFQPKKGRRFQTNEHSVDKAAPARRQAAAAASRLQTDEKGGNARRATR